jgi:hypothetical protein
MLIFPSSSCRHCHDTGRCDCIACGESDEGWQPGPCQFCQVDHSRDWAWFKRSHFERAKELETQDEWIRAHPAPAHLYPWIGFYVETPLGPGLLLAVSSEHPKRPAEVEVLLASQSKLPKKKQKTARFHPSQITVIRERMLA